MIFCYIVVLLGDNILWGIKRSTTEPQRTKDPVFYLRNERMVHVILSSSKTNRVNVIFYWVTYTHNVYDDNTKRCRAHPILTYMSHEISF